MALGSFLGVGQDQKGIRQPGVPKGFAVPLFSLLTFPTSRL